MKKIGLIYRFNPEENQGILVYGKWKTEPKFAPFIRGKSELKDLPIKFSINDCITAVQTGQLVYFELTEGKATKIEHASLANFDKNCIEELIKSDCFKHYEDNTTIWYEDISDITNQDLADTNSIDEILQHAGKYKIKERLINGRRKCIRHIWNKTIKLNILDISLWVNESIIRNSFFGKNVEEIKYLYDIFVLNMRISTSGKKIFPKERGNKQLSKLWRILLAKFTDDELLDIIKYAPLLQPTLPTLFCKKHIDVLNGIYGMPNLELCKLYCIHRIKNTHTTSEYVELIDDLRKYTSCNEVSLSDEGTYICQMGAEYVKKLSGLLEQRFSKLIEKEILITYNKYIIDVKKDINTMLSKSEIINLGLFFDALNDFYVSPTGYFEKENVIRHFETLSANNREILKKCINDVLILMAKDSDITPSHLVYKLSNLKQYIADDLKSEVIKIVNQKFSQLNDLNELHISFENGFISSRQYYERYVYLTENFDSTQYTDELSYKFNFLPYKIQWHIISTLIDLFIRNSMIYSPQANTYIRNLKDLLLWIQSHIYIANGAARKMIYKKTVYKIITTLDKKDRWTLFTEDLIPTPGIDNIRECLHNTYYGKIRYGILLKKKCFQDIMCSDLRKKLPINVQLLIVDNLDNGHLQYIKNKVSGFLQLYIWLKNPSDDFDWNAIVYYFHQFSPKNQIKLLKYIFRCISTGRLRISIKHLFDSLYNTPNKPCEAVIGILYIILQKLLNSESIISVTQLDSIIGQEHTNRAMFKNIAKLLFYYCNGHYALTYNPQDVDSQFFLGELRTEKNDNELCYAISFYKNPTDLIGKPIYNLEGDSIKEAEDILKINFKEYEYNNGIYYIPLEYEWDVKSFIMAYHINDMCGLLSDKYLLIENRILPKNNTYQPLYTNKISVYDGTDFVVCRCGNYKDSDHKNGIPFYWCNKKICVRRTHYLLPTYKWENYKFADLLYISFGKNKSTIDLIWDITSEISQFICDYDGCIGDTTADIKGRGKNPSQEIGIWRNDSSTVMDLVDEDFAYYEENDYQNDINNESPSYSYNRYLDSYDKYLGSYVQDECGYSDDDIDTIFEGDPSAYWNID